MRPIVEAYKEEMFVFALPAASLPKPAWMREDAEEERALGGPGSGNWGHGGTPGRGGSPPKASAGSATIEAGSIRVYHGTSSDAAQAIKREGIVPAGGKGGDKWFRINRGRDINDNPLLDEAQIADRRASVYLTQDRGVAVMYAGYASEVTNSVPEILVVDVPTAEWDGLVDPDIEGGSSAFMFRGTIKPDWIRGRFGADEIERIMEGEEDVRVRTLAGVKTIYVVLLTDEEDAVGRENKKGTQ